MSATPSTMLADIARNRSISAFSSSCKEQLERGEEADDLLLQCLRRSL